MSVVPDPGDSAGRRSLPAALLLLMLLPGGSLAGCIGDDTPLGGGEDENLTAGRADANATGIPGGADGGSHQAVVASATLLKEEVTLDGSETHLAFEVAAGIDSLVATLSPAGEPTAYHDVHIGLEDPSGTRVHTSHQGELGVGSSPGEIYARVDATRGTWGFVVSGSTGPPIDATATVTGLRLESPPTLPTPPSDGDARPIVAVIDTGVNPYHQSFSTSAGDALPARLEPVEVRQVPLTAAGSFTERHAADRPTWLALDPGEIYHPAGTRLLMVSMRGFSQLDTYERGHGTGVASVIADIAPEALILSVQVTNHTGSQMPAAIRWVANQTWVDIVHLSWGDTGTSIDEHSNTITSATRSAWQQGKLVVTASGNSPLPSHLQMYAGPPWTISVGQWNASTGSDTPDDGTAPDLVANHTTRVATADAIDGWRWGTSTSFSSPIVTGILAKAIGERLDRGGSAPSATELWHALNASARYPPASDYEPSTQAVGLPPGPAPAAQMGWGYLHPGDTATILGCLDSNCSASPGPSNQAVLQASQEARRAYWATP